MNRRNFLKIGAVAVLLPGCSLSVQTKTEKRLADDHFCRRLIVCPIENPYTIDPEAFTVLATSGMTVILPDATNNEGRVLIVKNISENKAFVKSTNLIDGEEMVELSAINMKMFDPVSVIEVICDGTTWHKM